MSAPDTNVEKQQKQHRPAILGIKAAVAFALTLLAVLIVWTFVQGQEIEPSETQIDGRTGEVVETE